jgi:hypothetical protein
VVCGVDVSAAAIDGLTRYATSPEKMAKKITIRVST